MLESPKRTALIALSMLSGLAWACSSDGETSGSGSSGTSGGSAASASLDGGGTTTGGGEGGTSGTGTSGTAGTGTGGVLTTNQYIDGGGGIALCGTETCQCADGIDNDNDGTADGFDAECTGPFDNDEGSFATGISGDNKDPKWQDCFFDGNSGAGDDDCRYHTDCIDGSLPASDPSCTVSDACLEFCAPLTPNGCDCFGCCTVRDEDGKDHTIFIGDVACTMEDLGSCQTCTPDEECGNTCGECELCPGRTVDQLPASCSPSVPDAGSPDAAPPPPAYTCDNGLTVCADGSDCGNYEYCSFGCCVAAVF